MSLIRAFTISYYIAQDCSSVTIFTSLFSFSIYSPHCQALPQHNMAVNIQR